MGKMQQSAAESMEDLGAVEMGGVGGDSVELGHNWYLDPSVLMPSILMGYRKVLWGKHQLRRGRNS